jgi:triphosphatase
MGEPENASGAAVSAPRRAQRVALLPSMQSEDTAALMLAECASQIRANAALVLVSEDPEAAHQLRIGLRRLRSAVRCLAPFCAAVDQSELRKDARWLGRQVSTLRDLDVLVLRVREGAARWPEEPGFSGLERLLSAQAADARTALRSKIEGARAKRFLVGLADPPPCSGKRAQASARDLGRDALDRAWKQARRLGRKTDDLDAEGRHDLRKALKHLRYTVEFFAPLFKDSKVRRYRKKLKRMQDLLGELNDLATAETVLAACAGSGGAATGDARNRLLDHMRDVAEAHWSDARKTWKALRQSPRFWR